MKAFVVVALVFNEIKTELISIPNFSDLNEIDKSIVLNEKISEYHTKMRVLTKANPGSFKLISIFPI